MAANLFPSFLLTFREALEAALIVAIVASYLKKTGRQALNKYLYQGAVAAVAVSILLGVGVFAVSGELEGTSEQIFEGVAASVATLVLTYMIIWMTKHAQSIKTELELKIEAAVTKGQLFGVAALSFVAVFREGLETVLFLTTQAIVDSWATLIGAIIAAATVVVLAFFLMRGMYRLNLKKFFQVTSIVLIIFAAGLAAYGTHELIEAAEGSNVSLGVLGQHAFDINPAMNSDGTYPLLHERGIVGSILAALVGYDGNPEWLRVMVYLGYWVALGSYLILTYRNSRFS
jgi:high-affinity iron transporter